MAKTARTYKLSNEVIKDIGDIAKKYGISQSDVITVLVSVHKQVGFMDEYDEKFTEYAHLAKCL